MTVAVTVVLTSNAAAAPDAPPAAAYSTAAQVLMQVQMCSMTAPGTVQRASAGLGEQPHDEAVWMNVAASHCWAAVY